MAGCGPGSGDETGGGSGGSGSGATDTATATATSSSGGSTGSGASCEMYIGDDDIGPTVDVTVRNATDAPLFLPSSGGCGGFVSISVRPEGGDEPLHIYSGECSPVLCEGFMTNQDCYLGCPDCAPPNFGRLEAGVSDGSASWWGVSYATLMMTAECGPGLECQRDCLRPDQAPDGSYEISAVAYRTCTGGTCECDGANPNGACYGWDQVELADQVTATATIDYPGTTAVELVFE